MRKIFLLLVITFFQLNTLSAQNETTKELNWISDFEAAKEIAKAENKPILIFFTGSDWCGICKMLDKDFLSSDKFKKIADEKLVLYKADFPRRTDIVSAEQKQVNIILDKKYSKSRNKRSFPTIVFINADGIELGYIESYNYIHDTTRHYGLTESILTQY
ncbi:MAG TPA: thioredoxin family protein [Crocinitomix sp.]|nr:thioredoxin family protein [Crocinitomix sp.]